MAFVVLTPLSRRHAHALIDEAPDSWQVKISEPSKKRGQEARYHAMIADIARQVDLLGERQDEEDAKRLLIDAFSRVMKESGTPLRNDGRIVPSLDGKGVVQLGIQSRKFRVSEASAFIEYLFAFGAEHDVRWSDPTLQVPEQYKEMA